MYIQVYNTHKTRPTRESHIEVEESISQVLLRVFFLRSLSALLNGFSWSTEAAWLFDSVAFQLTLFFTRFFCLYPSFFMLSLSNLPLHFSLFSIFMLCLCFSPFTLFSLSLFSVCTLFLFFHGFCCFLF